MSALTPKNGKYRGTWRIFKHQLSDKEAVDKYRNNFDNIKWGNDQMVEEDGRHGTKIIRFKGEM